MASRQQQVQQAQQDLEGRISKFLWPTILALLGAICLYVLNGMSGTLHDLKTGQEDTSVRLAKIETTISADKETASNTKSSADKLEAHMDDFERRLTKLEIVTAAAAAGAAGSGQKK